MNYTRFLPIVMCLTVLVLLTIAPGAYAQRDASLEKAIKSVFKKHFPCEYFWIGPECYREFKKKGYTGLRVKAEKRQAQIYCRSKHNEAWIVVEFTFTTGYKKGDTDFIFLSVGSEEIGYIVTNLQGHKMALWEYDNGPYKNRAIQLFGNQYNFRLSMGGEQIISRKAYFNNLKALDLEGFTREVKVLLGLK